MSAMAMVAQNGLNGYAESVIRRVRNARIVMARGIRPAWSARTNATATDPK